MIYENVRAHWEQVFAALRVEGGESLVGECQDLYRTTPLTLDQAVAEVRRRRAAGVTA